MNNVNIEEMHRFVEAVKKDPNQALKETEGEERRRGMGVPGG
jgi:hypothetical protein